jgi:hypothetical protein
MDLFTDFILRRCAQHLQPWRTRNSWKPYRLIQRWAYYLNAQPCDRVTYQCLFSCHFRAYRKTTENYAMNSPTIFASACCFKFRR